MREARAGNLTRGGQFESDHGRQRAAKRSAGGRHIALFGGTFDPIHAGHIAVARAAERRFHLDRVFFIPTSRPPHKSIAELSAYEHRFAMVALACSAHPRFVPSLAEASLDGAGDRFCYSIDTVRRFRQEFNQPGDRIYFIVGADSFLHVQRWKDYAELLELCDFVVANRPGFPSGAAVRAVMPPGTSGRRAAAKSAIAIRAIIHLRHTAVYLLETVASQVSATDVRQRIERGESIRGLVPPAWRNTLISRRSTQAHT